MELETINRLYLELSQVATATTAKEQRLKNELDDVDAILWPNGNKPTNYEPHRATRLKAMLHLLSAKGKLRDAANG